jgi:aspartate-semialdehyde dehydrogenase
LKVGFIGWRGMVGSVLLERMRAERDFDLIEPVFFSTSQPGGVSPDVGHPAPPLVDARDLAALGRLDAIVSCQGGDYTAEIHPRLRAAGWRGYWIDAASKLRMADDAVIVLDPVNRELIDAALASGRRDFIGGNCTVSLMMMAIGGLLRAGLVEWISVATYQAASGAGAAHMRELLGQMGVVHAAAAPLLADPASAILDLDRAVSDALHDRTLPTEQFAAPLAGSLIPWIDADLGDGQSREEWKAGAELNKMLGRSQRQIPVESLCVRIGAMRCHSQALTIKLTRELPLAEIESVLATGNEWVRLVPNTKQASVRELSPARVSGRLDIAVGRLRKAAMGSEYVSLFTVGDQLLWGAAEPLRRMLRILLADAGAAAENGSEPFSAVAIR